MFGQHVQYRSRKFRQQTGRAIRLRIAPYAIYQDVDGDISGGGTEVFEPDEPLTQGVRFDYFVEDTAFVRFEFVAGGRSGGYLSFVRRY